MNANLVHNLLNVIGLLIGVLLTVDWTGLGFTPAQAATVATTFILVDKVVKLLMNVTRDGFGGLWKVQPPVRR